MSKIKNLIQGFDIIKFLKHYNIQFSESGREISKNWIGIEVCPFCHKPKFHSAIHMDYKSFNCWICGRKSIFEFINKQLGFSNSKIYRELLNFQSNKKRVFSNKDFKSSCSMPKEIEPRMKYRFREYLKQRKFPLKVIKKYSLKNTNHTGDFKHRLIFPFYLNHELVTYVGRTISSKSYKDCPIHESKLFPKGTLFNFDNVQTRNNILITEGVFDVIRVGDNSVSTSGTNYSDAQVKLLLSKEPENVFICYDNEFEAQEKAQSLADKISLYVKNVEIITLPGSVNDVGELTDQEAFSLRKHLKLQGNQY